MPAAITVPYPAAAELVRNTQEGFRRRMWAKSAPEYSVFEDGFFGDALMDRYAASTSDTNGVAAAIAVANPGLTLTTGTDNDGHAGQGFALNFSGDKGFLFECVVELPANIDDFKFEVGLTDAVDDHGAVACKSNANVDS